MAGDIVSVSALVKFDSEGRRAMVKAWRFTIDAAYCAGSNPAWGRFSTLGHCFDVCVLSKALYPHMLHLTQL